MDTAQAYAVLDLAPGTDPKSAQQAYRRMALKFHPDRASDDSQREEFTRAFIKVRDAYEHLRKAGFPGPEPQEILEEEGLPDVTQGMAPAGRSFYKKNKKEDAEMSLGEKLGWGFKVDLEGIALWGVIIPAGAITAALFVRWLFGTLGAE